jgi:hypothetical protein
MPKGVVVAKFEADSADDSDIDVLFVALAKWERHSVGHSLGHLHLTGDRLWFVPHARSILAQGFDIPVNAIHSVDRSDNWFWRGAINIHLFNPLKLDVPFRLNPDDVMPGFEKHSLESQTLRLFLGFARNNFLSTAAQIGLPMNVKRP